MAPAPDSDMAAPPPCGNFPLAEQPVCLTLMVTNYVSANCDLAFATSKALGSELPTLLRHRGYMH
eukprot:1827049-Pyramimonas_sp.AAC.1